MKRFLSLVCALALLVTALSGCGDKKQPGKKGGDGGDNTELTYEVNEELTGKVTVAINPTTDYDFNSLYEAFQLRYPNVEVEPIVFEATRDDAIEYLTSLSMAKKKLPDVLFCDAGDVTTYLQNGWMHPLSSFLKDDKEWDAVPQVIRDKYTFHDTVYALPQTIHSNVVVVNEDLVEELNLDMPENDWTWDEFADFIKSCTNNQYSGVDDLSKQYNWIPGCMTDGRTISGYNPETKTFDLEAVRKFVNYYIEIRKIKGVEASSLYSAGGSDDYKKKFNVAYTTNAAFEAGKVACTTDGTWAYNKWNNKQLDFNWNFYPVPQSSPGRVPLHVDFCWMTTDIAEENKEAAWALLKFLTFSKDGNMARLTNYDEDHFSADMNFAYYIPVTKDADIEKKFKSLPNVTEQILYIYDNIDKGFLNDPEKTVPGLETLTWSTIGRLSYESMTGVRDYSSGMKDVEAQANAELAGYWDTFEKGLSKFESDFAASHPS